MRKFISISLFIILAVILTYLTGGCSGQRKASSINMEVKISRMQAVRFDPSYYYDVEYEVEALCDTLARHGIALGPLGLPYLGASLGLHGAFLVGAGHDGDADN